MTDNLNFDIQAAWLRRFKSDAESNLRAFALRLKEALPELVTVHESRGLFSRSVKTRGVSVELGEKRYNLEIDGGRLKASIAMVVHGVVLNTKSVDPAEWFARLAEETRKASDYARALSGSLGDFMAG
ncbi:hypothetical protein L6654_39385 [Bradyrhizobium sp. WYCCWR 13023]|uniref:Uncharacterized protein n=1 Tax=Bradyrhizobium zhengyangense TaxID=2911009 RepID=A0A9X1UF51_9BRAD|nr:MULTISPECIES: hypothetical protein [Bradyrhizobium]MCG2632668.1 hypothetical protein [Bradyrhizobium zhengyangense]MCG2672204.1 hypothetical protein [Bradyrhizobium zhengyangense]MDA9523023.1 hypothetical protein [Bradyrhizobium sp. CCBAU 11434]